MLEARHLIEFVAEPGVGTVAMVPSSFARMTKRVMLSTSVPILERARRSRCRWLRVRLGD
ncbi:MAG TPA: hypothetical protein VLO13_07895 [Halomonas sp.]|nr:hypothetical protein [Halomonas sp.]